MRASYRNMRVLLALMVPLASAQQTLSPLFQTTAPVYITATTTPIFTTTTPVFTATTTTPVLTTTTLAPIYSTTTPVTTSTTTAPVTTAASTSPVPWSCDDPSNPGQPVRITEKTTICIVLANNADWTSGTSAATATKYLRLSFQPRADEYSRFFVPQSYKDLVLSKSTGIFDGTNNVTIHVASQQALSFQRVFYNPSATGGMTFPFLTAIINLKNGIVDGITWDDACLFCNDDLCLENTYDFNGNQGTQEQFGQPTKGCLLTQVECEAFVASGEPQCDVTVHVVWTGTDGDGRAMQSSAFRFSAFPEQELANRLWDSLPELPELPDVLTGGR